MTNIDITKMIIEELAGTRSKAKLRATIEDMLKPSTSYVNNVPIRKLKSIMATINTLSCLEIMADILSKPFKLTS